MGLVNLSEKTKRFWAFLASFVYPALVLMGASSFGDKILELGFSQVQRTLFFGILLVGPILILIYFNIKLARQVNQGSQSKTGDLTIRWQDECLSLVLIGLIFLLPISSFELLGFEETRAHWSLFNLPSFLMLSCCFAFMLVINGGHALR